MAEQELQPRRLADFLRERRPAPFRRRSHVPAGPGAGLGLGVYIVGEIARAHGGELRAHSAADSGTTFDLLLPRTAT